MEHIEALQAKNFKEVVAREFAFVREITFTIPYLTDGLNGKTGLIRGHFMAAKKEKEYIAAILREQKPQGFYPITRRIKVTYTRYTSHLMDWDNACASFKHIGDALQMAGILSDDSPAVIAVFLPVQVKCKMAERRTEILIELI